MDPNVKRQLGRAEHAANLRREAELKQQLRWLIHERGLPGPDLEEVCVIPGRRYRYDLGYDEHRLLIEVQGGVWMRGESGHSSGTGISRDVEKFALAASYGWRVMPVTPDMIVDGRAVDWIERVLRGEAAA